MERLPLSVVPATGEAAAELPKLPRTRRRVTDRKDHHVTVRLTAETRADLAERAARAGLSLGAYMRFLASGSPGPRAVRRPPVERAELARLLAEFGKIGSNVNQLARVANTHGELPDRATLASIARHVQESRRALMQVLGRGD